MLQNTMYFTESCEYIYMYRQDPRYLYTCIFNGNIRVCSNGTCLFYWNVKKTQARTFVCTVSYMLIY